MFYFVEVEGSKIVSKNESSQSFELSEEYKEVVKIIFDSIGAIPCSFTELNGEITSVEYIEPLPEPEPEPTELELLKGKYDMLQGALDFVIMNF